MWDIQNILLSFKLRCSQCSSLSEADGEARPGPEGPVARYKSQERLVVRITWYLWLKYYQHWTLNTRHWDSVPVLALVALCWQWLGCVLACNEDLYQCWAVSVMLRELSSFNISAAQVACYDNEHCRGQLELQPHHKVTGGFFTLFYVISPQVNWQAGWQARYHIYSPLRSAGQLEVCKT